MQEARAWAPSDGGGPVQCEELTTSNRGRLATLERRRTSARSTRLGTLKRSRTSAVPRTNDFKRRTTGAPNGGGCQTCINVKTMPNGHLT